jgi:hypothetical protein
MSGKPSAGHTVGMADRDRAAVHVELLVVDTEMVTAVNRLTGEGFVDFPKVDIVDAEAVLF